MFCHDLRQLLSRCALVALAGALCVQPAFGAVFTWTGEGADANWTTGGNWDSDIAPGGVNTDDIRLAGSTGLAPVVDANEPWLLNSLHFNSGAGEFTLSGNTLRFAGLDGTPIYNYSSVTQTIDNPIAVAGGKQMRAHSEHLVFHGDFDLSSGSITFRGERNATVNGLVTGGGALSRTDGGTVFINNDNNTFSGTVGISHGVFEVASIANAGVASALGTGSTIRLGQGTWGPSDTGTLRYTGGNASTNRTMQMGSNAQSGGTGNPNFDVPSGRPTIEVTDPDTTLTFTGNFVYSSGSHTGRYWRLTGAGNGVVQGNILTTGAGILKDGTGTWTLAGDNTYEGVTTIDRGRLNISHANALGTTDGETIINGNDGATATTLGVSGNITIAEPITLNPLSQGRAYIHSSGNNTLSGPITLTGGSNLANLWSDSGFLTVSGDITGSLAGGGTFGVRGISDGAVTGNVDIGSTTFFKTEDSTWTIGTAEKTYAWGNTLVARGTLKMGAANVTPAGTVLTVGQNDTGNATFDLNGFNQTVAGLAHVPGTAGKKSITNSAGTAATLTVDNSSDRSFGGPMTGNLHLNKLGTGRLTLAGDSDYTGVTEVTGGILRVQHSNALGSTAGGTVVGAEGQLQLDGSQGALTIAEPITITGGNNDGSWGGPLRNISGNNVYSGAIALAASSRISQGGGNLLVTGGVTGNYGFTVNNGSGTITFQDNPINLGNNNLSIHSGGTTVLGVGSNTLRDVLIEWNGTLRLAVPDALPATSVMAIGNISGASHYAGRFDLDGNDQTLAGLRNVSTHANNEVGNSSSTQATLTINNASDYGYFSRLTGNLALTKSGAGTLTLGGDNTYSGPTTVSAGTLALSHDVSSNPVADSPVIDIHSDAFLDVTGLPDPDGFVLADGQTLQGAGTLLGNLGSAAGSTLAPGGSIGTLTVQGNFMQEPEATLQIEIAGTGLAGTDYDLLDVHGDASLAGWLDVVLMEPFEAELRDYFDVLTTTGSLDITGLTVTGHPPNPVFGWWDVSVLDGPNDGAILRLTAVPEPGAWLMLLCALAWGMLVRRRCPFTI